ncbi:MAG TPA: amidohydrolase [Paracoccaceae bacterium]|nr:amidohydrolase [Paracoccaceae bacterium]
MSTAKDDLIAWRRRLHQTPELSGQEVWTAREVAAALERLAPDALVTGLGGQGVIARFGGAEPKLRLMLRCELDGLPIAETNAFAHRSRTAGQGHLCGHDGHMAIVMGVAQALARKRSQHVDVSLLFQPAEETGAGAQAVLDDPRFAMFVPDVAVALHNMPGLPMGQVALRAGAMCCASRGLRIALEGRTAHASQPETGLSPAGAMTEIMAGLQALNVASEPQAVPDRMATVTHAVLGAPTFGVAPGAAEVFVTLRTIHDAGMQDLCDAAQALVQSVSVRHGLTVTWTWHDIFAATRNDAQAAALVRRAVKGRGLDCVNLPQPMRWSEDFGRFGAVAPVALFLLGAGQSTPALHNPDYDFPDALIAVGVAAFLAIIAEVGSDTRGLCTRPR